MSRRIQLLLQCLSLLHPHKPLSEHYFLPSSSDTVVLLLEFLRLSLQALDVGVLLQGCEAVKDLVQHIGTVLHCPSNFFQSFLNATNTLPSNFQRSGRLHLQLQFNNLEVQLQLHTNITEATSIWPAVRLCFLVG